MKNTLKIDNSARLIIMDRTFDKYASVVGSKEYEMLQMARRDYPNYTVVRKSIKKNPSKESYKGLTYEYMREYIESHSGADRMMKDFEEMILLSQCHSIRYPQIKKWFLNAYPEVQKYSYDNESQCHSTVKKVA